MGLWQPLSFHNSLLSSSTIFTWMGRAFLDASLLLWKGLGGWESVERVHSSFFVLFCLIFVLSSNPSFSSVNSQPQDK